MNNTFREALLDMVIEAIRKDDQFRKEFGDYLFAGAGFDIYKDDFYKVADEVAEELK